MVHTDRIGAVDVAKGIALLVIVALTDYSPGIINDWFSSTLETPFLNILATLSFGTFFYLSGITIPFYVSKKINEGHSSPEIIRMIFARTLILLVVGMMLSNYDRVNSSLTGFSGSLWLVLLVIAIFLVWNRYPEREDIFFTVSGLRILGLAILVFLVLKFNSGSFENSGSLIPGSWELPGMLGWGFLISALIWLALRNSIAGTLLALLFFLALNIIGALGLNPYLDPARKYAGIIIDGFIPAIILAGHTTGVLLKRYPESEYPKLSLVILFIAIIFIVSGIFTLKFFPEGTTFNNPAWVLTSTGAASMLFVILLWLTDLRKTPLRLPVTETAGKNFITAYILFFLVSGLISLSKLNILIYKTSDSLLIKTAGSVFLSFVIIFITSSLARVGIRLKF
ncbi:MAG TPA: hypothetical protein P5320_00980 [Bacteroidales bacterium]|nr:hypothetical protein [Bacteroidales bacterium]HRU55740.1 hypothetical protein [Bacteroidales bacterium]